MKKETCLNQTDKTPHFWLYAGLLAILLVSIITRDITRPFNGLHSWAQASGAWAARSHVKYGLGYTKGISTWAVGDPPIKNPQRYLDHPQLGVLTQAAIMWLFGINEWSPRIANVIISVIALIVFLKILRGLLDEKTALLAGLVYILFPLTAYFNFGGWPTLVAFTALWCYLVLIGELKDAPEPRSIHKYGLAISLFLALQFSWTGFFYAFAIGLHYVTRCVFHRRLPDKSLLAILILAPLLSLLLNFIIMASGYEWDFNKIVELYKWRSAKGEMPEFRWAAWFDKLWEFALTNFTLPILLTAILYLTFGQLLVFMGPKPEKQNERRQRQFPQFWLFTIPPLSQLLLLRGALWRHQTWERPLGPIIAIAATLGIMLLADISKKIHRKLAYPIIAVMVGLFLVYCIIGTNYYYSIRWHPPEKIELFKMLNEKIPPDKALLSYEPFIVHQHKAKGAFYRPEIAWYLDRDIVQATSFQQVQEFAKTGRYPYYLVPAHPNLAMLISQLKQVHKYEYRAGVTGEQTKDGKFLKAGMMPYFIFNLYSNPVGSGEKP